MPESRSDKLQQPARTEAAPAPPAPARPQSLPPADGQPGLRGQRERPGGKGPRRGTGRSRGGGRRSKSETRPPVSAREALDGAAAEATPLADLPSRAFEVDGVDWLVRCSGRTSIGSNAASRGALMHLSFSKEESPDEVALEALTVGDSLEALTEDELCTLLSRARITGGVGPSPSRG